MTCSTRKSPDRRTKDPANSDGGQKHRQSEQSNQYSDWLKKHEPELVERMVIDFGNLSYRWQKDDVEALKKLDANRSRSSAKIHDFAYNGIQDTTRKLSKHTIEYRPEALAEKDQITQLSINAISAIVVRMHYLKELARYEEDVAKIFKLSELKKQPFNNLFLNNILSAIYLASRLDPTRRPHAAEQPTSSRPTEAQSHQPEPASLTAERQLALAT